MSARKILIHTCCAPCLIAPLKKMMNAEQHTIVGQSPSADNIISTLQDNAQDRNPTLQDNTQDRNPTLQDNTQDWNPTLQSGSQVWDPTLLWFNPNIHPYTEYLKRRDTLKEYADKQNLPIIWQDEYDLDLFLTATSGFDVVRCTKCYELRLTRTAQTAMGQGFDAFTTTLLYSKYQRHEEIKAIGERLACQFGLEFYYEDWRELWQEGIDLSKAAEMYRQAYCGCIFSEKERYWKPSKVIK